MGNQAIAVLLNAKQLEVLEWVAAGSPNGVVTGYTHRVSAAALRSRGLVRISGRGPTWRAELTEAGRDEVRRLAGESSEETSSPGACDAAADGAPRVLAEERESSLSKTEQLVADVVRAGGKLVLPDETSRGGVNWRQRAYTAQRHGKVPDGKHLTVASSSRGLEIALADGLTGNELGADPIPVPSRVSKPHPAVREFGITLTHTRSHAKCSRARSGSCTA